MKTSADILNELQAITPQADLFTPVVPYQVPPDYFEGFSSALLNRIHVEEELSTLSPLLSVISKQSPYQVPPGYFEQRPISQSSATGKVINARFTRRFYRNAAAAVIAGLLFMGTWIFVQNTDSSTPPVVVNNTMLEKELLKVGENEIMAYLDSTGTTGTIENNPAAAITEDDIMIMLAGVPEEALKEYLEG